MLREHQGQVVVDNNQGGNIAIGCGFAGSVSIGRTGVPVTLVGDVYVGGQFVAPNYIPPAAPVVPVTNDDMISLGHRVNDLQDKFRTCLFFLVNLGFELPDDLIEESTYANDYHWR